MSRLSANCWTDKKPQICCREIPDLDFKKSQTEGRCSQISCFHLHTLQVKCPVWPQPENKIIRCFTTFNLWKPQHVVAATVWSRRASVERHKLPHSVLSVTFLWLIQDLKINMNPTVIWFSTFIILCLRFHFSQRVEICVQTKPAENCFKFTTGEKVLKQLGEFISSVLPLSLFLFLSIEGVFQHPSNTPSINGPLSCCGLFALGLPVAPSLFVWRITGKGSKDNRGRVLVNSSLS